MEDLQAFLAREDISPLTKAAIAHAQFETIHPFADGNRRTGRVLVQAILHGDGASRRVVLPVSAGLLHNVDSYIEALVAYRAGGVAPIITTFADTAIYASARGLDLVEDLAQIERTNHGKPAGVRADAAARRAASILLGQPVINTAHLVTELGLDDRAAQRAIATLPERAVITEVPKSRATWQQPQVLAALEEFAASVSRKPRR